ncbi:hypothetical protein T439DRAFT_375985 [Meredithblackwellia eburnea MCA 4105]
MRTPFQPAGSLLLSIIGLLSLRVDAKSLGVAGQVNNAVQASILQSAAALLEQGQYTITNVATGQSLVYTPVGNHVAPSHGSGSPFSLTHYGGSTSWVRLSAGSKNKCMSSQWGGSYDHAAVMYACAVSRGGATAKGNTLEPTKQWWLVVPVTTDLNHVQGTSNNLLVAAQKNSVKTREDAIKAGTSRNAFAGNSKRSDRAVDLREKRMGKRSKKHKKKKTKSAKKKTVKSGNAYFIIPTDHLIDMHTMALTGQSIDTAGNTVSTALASFSPSDPKQQWIITKV